MKLLILSLILFSGIVGVALLNIESISAQEETITISDLLLLHEQLKKGLSNHQFWINQVKTIQPDVNIIKTNITSINESLNTVQNQLGVFVGSAIAQNAQTDNKLNIFEERLSILENQTNSSNEIVIKIICEGCNT